MKKFVKIYSNEHGAWWAPNYCGYTNSKNAGIFDYEEAIKKYPYIKYGKNDEDYFVDIYPEMLKDEIDEIEHYISELQKKATRLRAILAEVK